MSVLVHLIEPAAWRAALRAGSVPPGPAGFVHLSRPEQVHLPATRLFPGRRDLVLLVVDPARLPHSAIAASGGGSLPGSRPELAKGGEDGILCGPLPTTAVVAVAPYRPPAVPVLPEPGDALRRALTLYLSTPVRRSAEVRDVPGGVAVVDPRFRSSRDDNRLLLDQPLTADEVERVTTGVAVDADWPHRAAQLRWPGAAAVAAELGRRGWDVGELVLMARPPAPTPGGQRAEVVPQPEVHPLWDRSWRRGGVAPQERMDDVVGELIGREYRNDLVVAVTDVAVRENGRVVAAGQLRVDGATAAVESVMTDEESRGRGHADAVLARLLTLAAEAGCDLVVLEADGADWPRHWYARRGFRELGSTWEVSRSDAVDRPPAPGSAPSRACE